ncbi:hypothetical protein [Paracoccus shanxieyensis]|uniref:Uncharacterized protein n=1 Tax=Paracoccus shanxieyensis TaxID=2675752 RepID=A0A6L6J3G0_9RHOB|nr:hypothetical protein [Paracoccus shanxieyensis]MTH66719.1 hypothetical protein [Paracoccus shanxieyensis]MTH89956.1 hypothetical protein [Paracoccus shanxieyensis]
MAGASVRIEDGHAVIRIPLPEVHALRVALAECPCRAPKSEATADIRKRLAVALGRINDTSRHHQKG